MSHGGQEKQGTGLRDIFDILVKAPPERLLSLTFQLGESPEDNIVHALCLIILQREAQALNKLQTLKDNHLAKHLAEKWQMSGDKLEDFAAHCGHFQEFTGESLAVLARIFKVMSEQRLCDSLLRNLAYKRALSIDDQKTSNCDDLEYDHLREEAKVVCGPQFVEWMCSPTDLKSGSFRDLNSSLDGGNTTLKVTLSQGQSERAHNQPSPLQASSSMPSYPTHLEISIPPTASFLDDKRSPETSDKSKLSTPVLLVSDLEAKNAPGQSQTSEEPQLKPSEPLMIEEKKHASMNETFGAESIITQTIKPITEPKMEPPTATNSVLPKMPVANEMHDSNSAEEDEDEETKFYAFVILHAAEDADMAETMKERLETVIGGGSEGATFSGDFATPGMSTLRCLEDAINNTAFTILLLTHNFSRSRMQEIETNSAVINSINKKHKFNTVIPLMPRENCMPRENVPVALQTIVPLDERRNFERKIQRSMSLAKIKRQEKLWRNEQTIAKQRERQERLKDLNQHQKQLIKEIQRAQLQETEHLRLLMAQKCLLGPSVPPEQPGGDGRACCQPNIHIEHASYIMIGNDSQMTVDLGGGADKDDSNNKEEEQ